MLENKNKTYKYKESEFTAHKNVLRIMRLAIPVQKQLQKYIRQNTEGINLIDAEKDKAKINEVRDLLTKTESYHEEIQDGKNKAEIERVKKRIADYKNELKELENKFNSNKDYKKRYELYNQAVNNSFNMLMLDEDIVIPFLKEYLIGDFSKLNFEEISIIKFISEVMTDFFLMLSMNPKE